MSKQSVEELKQALEHARSVQQELDKKVFHLRTLCETTHELSRFTEPEKLMDSFLLMAMGVVGAVSGCCMLSQGNSNDADHESFVVGRGLGESDLAYLKDSLKHALSQVLSTGKDADTGIGYRSSERLVIHNTSATSAGFPEYIQLLIGWMDAGNSSGLVGMGRKLSGMPYQEEDVELLTSLANTLAAFLSAAMAGHTITSLNQHLQENNEQLKEALARTEEAQAKLDKRVFHLNTFYDASLELSPLKDTGKIMSTFSLLLLGSLSMGANFILLFDQENKQVRLTHKGEMARLPEIMDKNAEKIIFHCINLCDFNKLVPLSAQYVSTRASDLPGELMSLLPIDMELAVLFRVDSTSLGLVGVGGKYTNQRYNEEEKEVLLTLVNNFLVFLQNARSFETIHELNQDLNARNKELQQTLDELTASNFKVEMLERAGARIRSLLQYEADRVGRVSLMDFLLFIIGSVVIGLLFNFSNPNGVDVVPQVLRQEGAPVIGMAQAKISYDDKSAIFIDARPVEFFKQKHLQDAINMPPSLFDFIYSMKFGQMDLDKPIVVYGRNISRHYDEDVAGKLMAQGHENVTVLSSSLDDLQEQGFSMQP